MHFESAIWLEDFRCTQQCVNLWQTRHRTEVQSINKITGKQQKHHHGVKRLRKKINQQDDALSYSKELCKLTQFTYPKT